MGQAENSEHDHADQTWKNEQDRDALLGLLETRFTGGALVVVAGYDDPGGSNGRLPRAFIGGAFKRVGGDEAADLHATLIALALGSVKLMERGGMPGLGRLVSEKVDRLMLGQTGTFSGFSRSRDASGPEQEPGA